MPNSPQQEHVYRTGDVFSLEKPWMRGVMFGAAALMGGLATVSLLWRQLDGLAVLALVVAAGLFTLFGIARQIPWTMWATFRREAVRELDAIESMRKRLGEDFTLQTLSGVISTRAGTFGVEHLTIAPPPRGAGFQWTAAIRRGNGPLTIPVEPGQDGATPDPSFRSTSAIPEIRVLYIPTDTPITSALPPSALQDPGASHRDGVLIIDGSAPPRVDEVHQALIAAGFRRLDNQAAPTGCTRLMPVRVAGPGFSELQRTLYGGRRSMTYFITVNGPMFVDDLAGRGFPASENLYTDDRVYTYPLS